MGSVDVDHADCDWRIVSFGGKTRLECGDKWWTWYRWVPEKYRSFLSIAFAFVAPHNHFVLDRGGKVFNRSAPVIKLAQEATEEDHLALLGLLNSSTACFWLKQVSQQKQLTGGDGVRVETVAKVPYEFAGTQMANLPLPQNWKSSPLVRRLVRLAEEADTLGQRNVELGPGHAITGALRNGKKPRTVIEEFQRERVSIRGKLILIQEEIDFVVYVMFGFADSKLLGGWPLDQPIEIEAGDRPFCMIRRRSRSHPESGCILNRLPRNPRYFSVNSWMIVNISYDRYLSSRTVVDFGSCKVFSMVFV